MKRILITAKHSYIGNSFVEWTFGKYYTYFISCRTDEWKQSDFSQYDVIFHVAGMAHVDANAKMEALYYKVNRDLTIELAKKAKADGVKQFIFISSIIVYGDCSNINRKRVIDINTVPQPTNFYGNSKLQAEKGIFKLQNDEFKVVILRPPMIYGKGSKGNYVRLSKMARKLSLFPDIDNQRSMLHIDNFCEFIRLMIDNNESGVFFPQNKEYVKTAEMFRLISEAHGRRVRFTRIFNSMLQLMGKRVGVVNKAFGNMVYEKSMSEYQQEYRVKDLSQSIIATEVQVEGAGTKMKKILMLTSVASMIDQFNMSNLEILKEQGFEVHVAANFEEGNTSSKQRVEEFKKELNALGIPYYHMDFSRNIKKIFTNIKAYKQMKALMIENKYEFVHCQSPIGGVLGRSAVRNTKTNAIYTAHGFHFYNGAPIKNWLIYYPIERYLARYTDVLITINTEDYTRAKKSFKARSLEYIPGIGLNCQKFSKVIVDKTEKRSELGVPVNAVVLLSVGELNDNKNHETAIRAIAKLNILNICYVICGEGKLKSHLEELAELLGIADKVKLLGFRADVREIYPVADIFVFPSFREGLSVSLMEAMAFALPVVCSDIRGNTDLIENGKGGYLVEPDDIDGFAEVIAKVIEDNELRLQMGRNNTEKIKQFDIGRVKEKMVEIYTSIGKYGGQ